MKIRTQFLISLVLFAVMLAVIGISLFGTSAELDRSSKQEITANDIAQGATELGYLANDYILNGEPQQRTRWETRFNELTTALNQLDSTDPATAALLNDIKTNQQSLQTVFSDVANTISTNPMSDPATHLAFVQVSWSRLQVPTQAIVFDASRLPNVFEDQISQIHLRQLILLVAIVILMIGYFIANYLLVYRRTLRSVGELQTGARFIGGGNFDYVMPAKYDDEISDLARSFNKMTASLKTVTASKTDLEQEVYKRAEAQEELHITNEELKIANENLQENAQKLELEIIEREKTEEALKESEAKARALIRYAPTGIYEIDFNGPKFLSINDAMSSMSGYSREELFNMGPTGLLDDDSRRKFADRIKRQLAGEPLDTEVTYRFKKKNGTLADVVLNVAFSHERPGTALVIGHDISERKRAEDALATANQKISEILASIQDDFYVIDRNWNFVYANRQYTSKIGKEPSDFIGRNYWQMFPNNIGTVLEENYRAAMERRDIRRFEWTGSYVGVTWRVAVFPSAEGITVIGEDVTEFKKSEDALHESYAEMERVNRAAVDRELRMIDLKKEINKYYIATGQPPRYMLDLD